MQTQPIITRQTTHHSKPGLFSRRFSCLNTDLSAVALSGVEGAKAEHWILNTLSLFTLLLTLAPRAEAQGPVQTNNWTGAATIYMDNAANWSLGSVSVMNDIARWNLPSYPNQPTITNTIYAGMLLFDTNNTAGVTIGGAGTLVTDSLGEYGIRIEDGSGTVTINAPINIYDANAGTRGTGDQTWTNNLTSGSGKTLTLGNVVSLDGRWYQNLFLAGPGDYTFNQINASLGNKLIMNGAGVLTLTGSAENSLGDNGGYLFVNSGTVRLDKSGTARAFRNGGSIVIGQVNPPVATLQLTGSGTDQIQDGRDVNLIGNGRFDFNGKTEIINTLYIYSTGAGADSTPLLNTAGGGALTVGGLSVTPQPGYRTTLDTGTGKVRMSAGSVSFGAYSLMHDTGAGSGRIAGTLDLGAASRGFNVPPGAADDDLTIDAVITGDAGAGISSFGGQVNNTYYPRTVLAGNNTFSGPMVMNQNSYSILSIRNSVALGTVGGAYNVNGTFVGYYNTLELQGGIAVGAEALRLESGGVMGYAPFRNAGGNNSWNGPITLTYGNPRINSDSGTLTLGSGATISGYYMLYVGGLGNVTMQNGIENISGFQKDGAGTLRLEGPSWGVGPNLYAYQGKLVMDFTSGGGGNAKTRAGGTLNLNKGTLELANGSQTEAFYYTTFGQGAVTITRTGGSGKLRLNTVNRFTGNAVNFAQAGIADTDALNSQGILNGGDVYGYAAGQDTRGYATVAGGDWAYNSTAAGDGPIAAVTAYTNNGTGSTNSISPNNSDNVDMSAGDTTLTLGDTVNSLRFNSAAPRTLTLSGVTLNVSYGGILNTANVGANNNLITGGTLANVDWPGLSVHQYNTSGTLTIDSVISAYGFTKSGPGTLVLGGTAGNSFSQGRGFFVNDGEVQFNKSVGQVWNNASEYIYINQTGRIILTGSSGDQILDSRNIYVRENGRFDFNGKTETVNFLQLYSPGASGDTTMLTNSTAGGNLTINGGVDIYPLSGYTTTLDSGTGTLTFGGGNLTMYAGGSGVARIKGNLALGATRNFGVGDGEAADDLTVDAVISGGAGVGFTQNGNYGRLVLTGNNTFQGNVNLGTGNNQYNIVLNIRHAGALGTGAGTTTVGGSGWGGTYPSLELQGGINVTSESLTLYNAGSWGSMGALRNVSGNNTWGGSVTLGAASRINSDSGTLVLNSGSAITGAGLGLTIGGAGNVTISNAIQTTTGTLTKDGAGALTLSGANTFTGTSDLQAGTLVLDYSAQDNTKLSDSAALYLRAGTLMLSSGNHTEVVASTTIQEGATRVTRPSGTSILRMNAITRSYGGTIDFAAESLADTDTVNYNTAGILGGYATVQGATWAVSTNASAADTPITGLPDAAYRPNDAYLQSLPYTNYDMSAGFDSAISNSVSVNSIRFNANAARTLTISNGVTLTVNSGGILNTPNVGAYTNTITGGYINPNGEAKIHQYNTSAPLVIDSVIQGSYFTKTGPGTLILGGGSANTFANSVYVTGGEVDLNKTNGNAVSGTAGWQLYIQQGAVVKHTGTWQDQIQDTLNVAIYGDSALDFNGHTDTNATVTINAMAYGTATNNTTPIRNSSGGGELTINGNLNITPLTGYTTTVDTATGSLKLLGNVVFNTAGSGVARIAGNLNLGTATRDFSVAACEAPNALTVDAAITGAPGVGLNKSGLGRLILTGSNSYSGVTMINPAGGYLNIQNGNALGTNAVVVNNQFNQYATLELQGNIAVGNNPLRLWNTGVNNGYGALRNISGNNSWAGPITLWQQDVRINSDSGTLTLSGGIQGGYGLTVGGAGNVTLSGALDINALAKDGNGVLTLAGPNLRTGTVTLNGGKILLDYSTDSSPKLTDRIPLTLGRCALELSGGNSVEALGRFTLGSGLSTISRASGTSVLRLNSIFRGNGNFGVLDFAADDIAQTDSANYNGILSTDDANVAGVSGYATVGSNTWAYNSTGGADGSIKGLPLGSYATNGAGITNSISPLTTDNVDMSAGDTILTADDTVNTLRFNSPAARTVGLNAANRYLTINVGSILVTPNVGANTSSITNGILQLVGEGKILQFNTGAPLVIDSVLNQPYLTKVGPGQLILGGNVANTGNNYWQFWGGETWLNKSVGPAIGTGSDVNRNISIYGRDTVLKYTGTADDQIADNRPIYIGENGALDFNGHTDTIRFMDINSGGATGNTTPIRNSGVGGGLILSAGGMTITPLIGYTTTVDTATGMLTLGGTLSMGAAGSGVVKIKGNLNLGSSTRSFTVANGDASDDMVIDAVITNNTAGAGITVDGKGRLVLTASNTFAGTVTVSGGQFGTLNIRNGGALGTTSYGTVVADWSVLELQGGITIGAETLNLQVNNNNVSTYFRNVSGNNTWGGQITLTAGTAGNRSINIDSLSGTLTIDSGSTLTPIANLNALYVGGLGDVVINDALSGAAGTIWKYGRGTVTLGGAAANTYTGTLTVDNGTLKFNKTGGVKALTGQVTINQTSDGNGGRIDIAGADQSISNVVVASTTATTSGNRFDPTPIVNTGVGGTLSIGALTITPEHGHVTRIDSGSGTLKLGGTVTFIPLSNGNTYNGRASIAGTLDLNGTRVFNVGLPNQGPNPNAEFDLKVSAVITNGALVKTGMGRLYLSGASVYTGDTLVSTGGTLRVGLGGSILTSPTVTVSTNAILQLDHGAALGTNATLALLSSGGSLNGKVNLNFAGMQTVAVLRLDGVTKSGTWGSSSSPAANKNDMWFSGIGVVYVNGPEIANDPVSGVTATSANFNGRLPTAGSGGTMVGVMWGTNDAGVAGAWANTNWFDGTGWTDSTTFSTNINTLVAGTTNYYTYVASNAGVVVRAAPSVSFVASAGTVKTWTGAGSPNTDWATAGNWSPAGVPSAADDVTIPATANQPTLNLYSGPVTIKSLTMSGDTLTITYGDASTRRLRVDSNVLIGASATLTHTANPGGSDVHRLYMDVGGSLTNAGTITADYAGYPAQTGPGRAIQFGSTDCRGGGAHGGVGGPYNTISTTYGSITNPVNNGSGGWFQPGGGCIVLQVAGSITNTGNIYARGRDGSSRGPGSGGSINITADSIGGAGNINADGGRNTEGSGDGGGGRVAIRLTGGGAVVPANTRAAISACLAPSGNWGGAGTIYLEDSSGKTLIVDQKNRASGMYAWSQIVGTRVLNNTVDGLTSIIVTNNGALMLSSNAVFNMAPGCTLLTLPTTTNTLFNGGTPSSLAPRLILAAGGTLNWTGTWTNNGCISWNDTNCVLSSSGSMVLASTNALLTHELSGAYGNPSLVSAIRLDLEGDLVLTNGGAIYVSGRGWGGWTPSPSYYSGSWNPGDARYGGSHGGECAVSGWMYVPGDTYDSITNPVMGGLPGNGSVGAGVAILRAANVIIGTNSGAWISGIYANGIDHGSQGAGAGGTINITAGQLLGNGVLQVKGGNGGATSGGGGRLAVALTNASTFGSIGMDVSGGIGGGNGSPGTIYLKGNTQTYGTLTIPPNTAAQTSWTKISPSVPNEEVGDVVVQGGTYPARFALAAGRKLTVYGNWTNSSPISIGANTLTGTVEFAGPGGSTISGSTVFWTGFVCTNAGKTLLFEAGKTNTMLTALNLAGASMNPVALAPATAGQQWYIKATNTFVPAISYVAVSNSTALTSANGQTLIATFSTLADVGVDNTLNSNTNWSFPAAGLAKVWNGSASASWGNDNNWTPSGVPGVSDASITIPAGMPNQPALDQARGYACPITIANGATLTLGWNLTLDGALTNLGAIVATGSETLSCSKDVYFTGGSYTGASSTLKLNAAAGAAQTFSPGNCTFYNIQVANAATVTVQSAGFTATNFTCRAAGARMNFQNGSTYRVNALVLQGASGTNVTVRSTSDGAAANLIVTNGYSHVRYVDVQDNDASGGRTIYAFDSVQGAGGNTPNWDFGAGNRWVGIGATGTGSWFTASNWSSNYVPSTTTHVLIDGGNPTLILTNVYTIKGLTLGMTSNSTLTVANGNLDTRIMVVDGDVGIGPNGTLTHAAETATGTTVGNESNRLCLAIGGQLTIEAGGQINVDAKGYAVAQGPGRCLNPGDNRGGGGHGGKGGQYNTAGSEYGQNTYGSITNPVNSGSGGSTSQGGAAGGGCIVLNVAGAVRNNGAISANGGNGANRGPGSGGSINLTAGSIAGNTGTITADGGRNFENTGSGGGGRIAVKLTGGGTVPDSVMTNISASAPVDADRFGGAGTIFIKDASRNDLSVDQKNRVSNLPSLASPFRDGTYNFARIVVTNQAQLALGTNAVLDLTGTTLLTPPSTTNSITSRLVVGMDNGYMTWNGTWTNTGCISWYSNTYTYTVPGSLVIASNAFLTHEVGSTHRINLNIAGNLTVDSGGAIFAEALCNASFDGHTGRGGAAHGGEGGYAGATIRGTTYGSITNPITYGSSNQRNGGGVVLLNVGGAFTNNGLVSARGYMPTTDNPGGSAGGSLNITVAGDIASSGTITADGGTGDAEGANDSPGGGGRIAIKLTGAGKTFGNVNLSKVTARGGRESDGLRPNEWGQDGTIYLKTGDQTYGSLLIRGNDPLTTARTFVGTNITDTTVGDVELQNGARLALSNNTLTVYGSWTNAGATNAISGGTVEFAGTDAATVWGGNTWSNLTIATFGKTVNFEAGKTQFVYGVAAFSNVTLQSSVPGNWWYLQKPGVGTQDVGTVSVQDSNAGATPAYWAFRGYYGSVDAGNNSNWLFLVASTPLIANQSATGIGWNSANLNGFLNSTGTAETAVWVYWGSADQTTNASQWANTNFFGAATAAPTPYTTNLTGLANLTTHWYNYFASNANGTVWGSTNGSPSFTTYGPPTVAVSNATGIGVGAATLNGRLIATNGLPTTVFFCWGTNDYGTGSTSPWNVVNCGTATNGQSFSSSLSGLIYGIRYWYYAYATNAAGAGWSGPTNFLTAAPMFVAGVPVTSGLVGWYDAGVQVTTNASGVVQTWNDLSGNARHATLASDAPTRVLGALNGLPIVQFRGNNDYLNVGGTTLFAKEHYYVFRCRPDRTTWSSYGSVFGKQADDRNSSYLFEGNTTYFHVNQYPDGVSRNGAALTAPFDLGTITNYMVLKVVVNNNNTAATTYRIGGQAANVVDMDLAEILVYNAANAPADEGKIGGYLAWKYNISTLYTGFTPPFSLGISNTLATAVGPTQATLNGVLTGTNSFFDVYAYWGPANGTNNPTAWSSNAYVGAFTLSGATTSSNIAYTAGLVPDTGYWYTFCASNAVTNFWATPSQSFNNGQLTVASTVPTTKYGDPAGQFTISRPTACTNVPLTVYYAMSGSANNGQDYTLLTGSTQLVAGATSVVVSVTAIVDGDSISEDAVLTLLPSGYPVGAASNATVTIQPTTGRRWLGGTSVDWANPTNWIPPAVPGAADDVVINGGAYQPLLNLSLSGVAIQSLTLGTNLASTLTITNSDLSARILIVSGDVLIGPIGTVTHAADGSTGTTVGSESNRLCLAVGGNLTIAAGGQINVDSKGYGNGYGPGASGAMNDTGGGAGGGYGGEGNIGALPVGSTYGSLTNPVHNGSSGYRAAGDPPGWGGVGGGTVVLRVSGVVTNNGVISANGQDATWSPRSGGAGGTINIVAGALDGTGRFAANGGNGQVTLGLGPGGGGRVALVVTNAGATISTAIRTNVFAYGGGTYGAGAAGTIYLKAATQDYGDLLVNNGGRDATNVTTLIGTLVTDTVVGDVQLLNMGRLTVAGTRTLEVNGSWSNAVALITGGTNCGGTVVFAGTNPNPVTVWGGNIWSNLTIATAGKRVNFEAGKTQTVYGVAVFSNVTLRSTSPGTWWYLLKPGAGTQDVGRVWVQDSNAGGGWAFRAAGGASMSHNVNWICPPQGTVIFISDNP